MSERYGRGTFSRQRGDVIHKSSYGKNILILVKSPSGRVKDRLMLTKQKNGTYKVENTGKKRKGTRRGKKKRVKTNKRRGKIRRRRRTNKRRNRRS